MEEKAHKFIEKTKSKAKSNFVNKVKRGPLASILGVGPLKKWSEEESQSEARPELREVNYNYHKLSFDEINRTFPTSVTNGLTTDQAKAILAKNGPNMLKPPETHYIRKIIGYFTGGFCWILWIGVLVCFLSWEPVGSPPDPTNLGLSILFTIVILLQAGFEAFQDFSSNRVMNSIKNMMAADATVIRDGVEVKVPAAELVVGDLVLLTYGQIVPADIRIIELMDLKFDRAMLTGESEAVEGSVAATDDHYTESKNIGFMATLITNGTGKAIVTLTGENTMIGSIAVLTAGAKQEKTTLQKEIRKFVIFIVTISLTTLVITIILYFAWIKTLHPTYINTATLLVDEITLAISFIPTGLPVSVTLSLLLVAKRMAKNSVLVKNLTVIETLSCVTVIASDKTGTLTQNKMYVVNMAAGLNVLDIDNPQNEINKTKSSLQLSNSCALCNEAKFNENEMDKPIKDRGASGGATDIAILKYAAEQLDIQEVEKNYTVIDGIPFNSKNKWMARIFKPSIDIKGSDCFELEEGECCITMKGAPDILINKCSYIINDDGTESEFLDTEKNALLDLQHKWCSLGQRVLIICKKIDKIINITLSKSSELEAYLKEIDDFCILGIVGIIDKPREGIDQVIKTCRGAGVRVFMVTGDFSITAAAIASQIGIFSSSKYDTINELMAKCALYSSDIQIEERTEKKRFKLRRKKKIDIKAFEPDPKYKSLLLTGTDLETLEESYWRTITKYEEVVFARTTPSQKLKVVEEFKHDKNVVAVTGDGVNDSPALKAANIGIAMGGGSEVAMAAAQVVLIDNSFNSLVKAIESGRLVFDNLRKVILFLIPAGTFSEIVPIILNVFFGVPKMLSNFQMICICILTDVGPSLAMMLEKSEGDLMKRKPRVIGKDHLVDKKLLLFAYFFLGVFESLFSIIMFFLYMFMYGGFQPSEIFFAYENWQDGYHNKTIQELNEIDYTGQTVTFVALVFLQTFGNIYMTRTHILSLFQSLPFLKAHRNLWLFLAQFSVIGIIFILIYVPFFNDFFKTRPIPVEFYFIPLGFCALFITVDEIRKLMVRRKVKFFVKTAW